jgi:hypothetical protein
VCWVTGRWDFVCWGGVGVSVPECAEGGGDEAVAELGGVGAAVEDGSGEEAAADAVAHPGEVGGVGWADGGGGFEFDGNEAAAAEVDDQVDLVSPVRLALPVGVVTTRVVQSPPGLAAVERPYERGMSGLGTARRMEESDGVDTWAFHQEPDRAPSEGR